MAKNDIPRTVEAVRRFNRFYTRQIGVLDEELLKSPFSLTEARVLYELAHREQCTATDLVIELGLNPGYLSRIIRSFESRGLIARQQSETDGRQSILSLTDKGAEAFSVVNSRTRAQIERMLVRLSDRQQKQLVEAAGTIERLLGAPRESAVHYVLRLHEPGDLGWIVHRHGVVYAAEYGWNEEFEGLVAEVAARFLKHHDPKRERCWIAEMDGKIVGSIMLVRQSAKVAKLRLLLVEPEARGLGLGKRLVNECIRFARQAGYRKITLWTNNVLVAARHIYEQSGFQLTGEERHHSFGHDLVSETWDLDL